MQLPLSRVNWTLAVNFLITVVLAVLAVVFLHEGDKNTAGMIVGGILLLWRHPGIEGPPPAAPSSAAPLLLLLLSSCDSRLHVGVVAWPAQPPEPRTEPLGTYTDALVLTPQSSITCPTGQICLFGHSGTGLPRWVDASGNSLVQPADALVLHKAGTETVTGTKTFSAGPVLGAGATASGSTAIDLSGSTGAFKTPTGAVTVGPGAVTVSGNATFGGTVGGSGITALFASPPAIGGTARAAGNFSTLSVTTPLPQSSGGTGRQTCAANTVFAGPTSGGAAAPDCRALAAADFAGSGSVAAIISAQATTAIGVGLSAYLVAPGVGAPSTTAVPLVTLPINAVARDLRCSADTLPGGMETVTCTLWKRIGGSGALSSTSLTCAIDSSGLCSDTTNAPAVTAGSNLYLKCAQSAASIAAGINCGFSVVQ